MASEKVNIMPGKPTSLRVPRPYEADAYNLGGDNDLFREQVARFVLDKIEPLAESSERAEQFPHQLWAELGAAGLLGIAVEEKYGGQGGSYLQQAVAAEEISRASGGIGLSYIADVALCMSQIARFGTEAQKEKYLPGLCAGSLVGALMITEVEAGSDAVSMTTKGLAVPGGWVLNGSKYFITNGPTADVFVAYAKTDLSAPPKKGITAFILEKGMNGLTVGQKIGKVGMKSSDTSEIVLEDVFVPDVNILGDLNGGTSVMMRGLDYERVALSAGTAGILQACVDVAHPYVCTRKQFGAPLSDKQLVQEKMVKMDLALHTLRSDVYRASQRLDRGYVPQMRKDAARVFYLAAEAAEIAPQAAMQLMGGAGYTTDWPVERYWRDAQLYLTGGGTKDIRLLVVADALITEITGRRPGR